MKTVCKFEGVETEEFIIPPFELKEGEYVLIECRRVPTYYKVKKLLLDYIKEYSIHQMEYTQHVSFFDRYSPFLTIKKYLEKYADLASEEIEEVSKKLERYNFIKVKKLLPPEKRILALRRFIEYKNNIFIDTASMHLENLVYTYELVVKLLEKGGSCIDLTYPPFDHINSPNDFIKLDKSKIKSFLVIEKILPQYQ